MTFCFCQYKSSGSGAANSIKATSCLSDPATSIAAGKAGHLRDAEDNSGDIVEKYKWELLFVLWGVITVTTIIAHGENP